MTMQEKIKLALGEMMLNQISMADTIEQLQKKVEELTKVPEPQKESEPQ